MKEARKKLEEFFPELLEIKEGSLILTPHFNFFSQKYEEDVFDEYVVINSSRVFNLDGDNYVCQTYDLDKHFSNYKVENPILLNHVIMYVQSKCGIGDDFFFSACSFFFGSVEYDLTRPFEEQSELFYEFINKL